MKITSKHLVILRTDLFFYSYIPILENVVTYIYSRKIEKIIFIEKNAFTNFISVEFIFVCFIETLQIDRNIPINWNMFSSMFLIIFHLLEDGQITYIYGIRRHFSTFLFSFILATNINCVAFLVMIFKV